MRKFRAGPLEVEFDRIGAEVEAVVGRPTLSISEAGKEQGAPVIEELSGLAEASPVAAVMDAHAVIEQELRNIVDGVDPQADVSKMAMGQLIRLALDKGAITPETAKAVEGITVMRNLAAHGRASEVTVERARDYLALADAVLYTLRQKLSST